MNIQSIQCPCCGGNLNVENVNQSLIYCMFCGTAVQVETNHNKGYDMELGRLDARAELADETLAKIEKIKPELIRNFDSWARARDLPSTIYEIKADLHDMRFAGFKPYVFKPFGIGLGILFGGAIVVICISSKLPEALLIPIEALVLFAPIYLPLIGLVLKIKNEIHLMNIKKEYEADLVQAQQEYQETEAYINKNAEVNIPPRFRQEAALDYIVKGFKAREFVTLEQALFKCEDRMNQGAIPDRYVDF